MSARDFHFTSESVTEGHPDKMADQISDTVLDAVLAEDPLGRVACETFLTTGLVARRRRDHDVRAPSTSRASSRERIAEIGYTRAEYGFDAEHLRRHRRGRRAVARTSRRASTPRTRPSTTPGDDDPLDRVGAGDQGMMFGYACRETDELMPLPITLAHKICKRLAEVRKADELDYLRPDGKAQVTVRYEVDEHGRQRPVEIERVLISTQHADGIDAASQIKPDLIERVLHPILPGTVRREARLEHDDFVYVNPTGRFVVGGPMGDTGLTGRKIIVDTYGGAARHGGGAFSGKDPTKVDRSAAYAARYVAKNVVAAGPRRPLRAAGRLRDRRRAAVLDPRRVLRHRAGPRRADRGADPRALRPAPGGDHARPRPAPPDLREDRGVRPLRPRRPRLHVGADGQGGAAARGRRPRRPRSRKRSEWPSPSSARSRSTRSRRRSASASASSAAPPRTSRSRRASSPTSASSASSARTSARRSSRVFHARGVNTDDIERVPAAARSSGRAATRTTWRSRTHSTRS